ncbi:cation-translocating P-type ATPase [Anaerolinea thermophila]|uniref:Cation-transporting ATPase n=1 Tax=Anaerolinea thermophila (strain DSM 14523 / JCM 11388 / NBRC 100420 / UNI-1) TaxID=926569 RepID=E8N301_ANATU|nr:cation-translocating P-type ATPase [Anaerolinea thermophila]BAJ65151.1 cation-transporting ATPase [Anaerolinea thermophila UNI-1]
MATPSSRPAMPEEIAFVWHALSPNETLQKLNTAEHSGLSSEEAARRLAQYGANELAEKPRPTFLQLLIAQLNSFVVILLIVAAGISAVLGEWVEAGAILAIVVLNAVLGVVQESRAQEALAALKKMAAPEAQVLRDGKRLSIPARELVPGDIVFLEAGNYVPADVRLLEAVNLRVEEAALTGESVPVQKSAAVLMAQDAPIGDRKNTAYMGTVVSYGRGRGVVVATGMRTQLGMIADMLQSMEEEQTPLQRRLDELGKTLGWGALAVCALVFVVGLVRMLGTDGFQIQQVVDLFMIAVSLAIAAVPEGLPAIVTISLALGMREMVRRHALIRKLASVETLGSATVICSDKTGTLTQNAMTATRLWVDGKTFEITGQGYNPEGEFRLNSQPVNLKDYPAVTTALWVGVLNNDAMLEQIGENGKSAYRIIGDPTEGALLVAAAKAGILQKELTHTYPREQEVPFDSSRKRMVTIHEIEEVIPEDSSPIYNHEKRHWYAIAVKGAPDIVLNLCTHYQRSDDTPAPLDDAMRAQILAANDAMTYDALRVLGLAYRLVPVLPEEIESEELEKDLIFVGLIGMIDPARPEVQPALEKARTAGIRTIMITGDYPNTARAIAESIHLLRPGHQVLTGAQLNEMDDQTLIREVERTDVFARVSPEHKMRIVDALRANGEVVAMTGDGVNDAPAIKRADIGVSMGITGTDVAKETADMVLTDDNYASIVAAIEQGRIIYSNIRKFVYYLLSCNLAEIAIIFLSTLFMGRSPLTALQLLWLNLVTDGAPALALGTEKGDPDIMHQPPRPPKEPIINRFMLQGIVFQTLAITATTLLAFWIGSTDPQHVHYAETMAFVTLSVSELLRAYTARSEYYPLVKIGVFTNRWMNLAVLSSLALILGAVYVPFLNNVFDTEPLGWAQWVEILPLILIPSVVAEATKVSFAPHRKKTS